MKTSPLVCTAGVCHVPLPTQKNARDRWNRLPLGQAGRSHMLRWVRSGYCHQACPSAGRSWKPRYPPLLGCVCQLVQKQITAWRRLLGLRQDHHSHSRPYP